MPCQDVYPSIHPSDFPSICLSVTWDGNIPTRTPPNGGVECKGYEKITIFDQYLALSRNWCKTEPWLLWKAYRKPHPSFWMVPVWMILSDLQCRFWGHDIIQRQITQKRYQSYTYNGGPIESRIWSIERRHFQWPWTTPNPVFKVTHSLTLNIS